MHTALTRLLANGMRDCKMGEIIANTDIKKEEGFLYYVAFDENKNLVIGKAKLSRGGRKKCL